LHVSSSTVQAHVANAMRKLGASSRTQLAVRALREGIVPLHPEGERGLA
jgi:DNA-binding NarL/FixJ family response regulator